MPGFVPGFGFKARMPLCALLLMPVALSMLTGVAMAEGKTFSANAVKRVARPLPQGGWLDLSDVKKPLPAKTQIQDDYVEPIHEKGIIGIDLRLVNGEYPLVQAVFKNSPAYFKGILPGDSITAVNGVNTFGRSRGQVDALISDVPGQKVEFTVDRGGMKKRITVTVLGVDELSANDFLNP